MLWDILLGGSLLWICYRLYHLIHTPRNVLEHRFCGVNEPLPSWSVVKIGSDAVTLQWLDACNDELNPHDLRIAVNGKRHDAHTTHGCNRVLLSGLDPATEYHIDACVGQREQASTKTTSIWIQTLPLATPIHQIDSPAKDSKRSIEQIEAQSIPRHRKEPAEAFPCGPDDISSSPTPATTSSCTSSTKQMSGVTHAESIEDGSRCVSTPQDLSERIEMLQKQEEEIKAQMNVEQDGAKAIHDSLTQERDRMKTDVKAKEEELSEARRQAHQLDKAFRSSQNRMKAKERQLQQRQAQRAKGLEKLDAQARQLKWNQKETGNLRREADSLRQERELESGRLRKDICTQQSSLSSAEEEVHRLGSQIRRHHEDETKAQEAKKQEEARSRINLDQIRDAKCQDMQSQLATMWQMLEHSKQAEYNAEQRLCKIMTSDRQHPRHYETQAPLQASLFQGEHYPGTSSRVSSESHQEQATHTTGFDLHGIEEDRVSDKFICLDNRCAPNDHSNSCQCENQSSTTEHIASPIADELLPSNLFYDDDFDASIASSSLTADVTPSSSPQHLSLDNLDKSNTLTTTSASPNRQRTNSSWKGEQPSAIPSPSQSGLRILQRPQTSQSSGSSKVSFDHATTNHKSLFDTKVLTADRPLLGSIRHAQTQSVPRTSSPGATFNRDAENTPCFPQHQIPRSYTDGPTIATGRTKNAASIDGILGRRRAGSGKSLSLVDSMIAPPEQRSSLDLHFMSRQSSAQQSPSHSSLRFDPLLSGTSAGSLNHGNIWGDYSGTASPRSHPAATQPWTTHARSLTRQSGYRPSLRHESSTNLSIGSTPLDMDDILKPRTMPRTEQAPIGTRPDSSKSNTGPRLNPAAPSFKTIFGPSELDTKEPAAVNGNVQDTMQDAILADPSDDSCIFDTSNFDSKMAWDQALPPETLLENHQASPTLAFQKLLTPNGKSSMTYADPEVLPYPSKVDSLGRKSSASKFGIPWAKDKTNSSNKHSDRPASSETMTASTASEALTRSGKIPRSSGQTRSKASQHAQKPRRSTSIDGGSNGNGTTPSRKNPERTGRAWSGMRRKVKKKVPEAT